jgi:hypothetical protein
VTGVDWLIVVGVLVLAAWGYTQGFLVALFTLVGFTAGAIVGSRIGPSLLSGGAESPYAPLTGLAGALLLGGMAAVIMEGLARAIHLRFVRSEAAHVLDGAGGAILLGVLGLGLAWIIGAVALHAPGARDLRHDIQRSVILQKLNDVLPPSGPILHALNRIDPGPSINGPRADVAPPDPKIARDPDVVAAGQSVVRILGTACGLGIEGSGWLAAPGLVVTNAHVVAGESDTSVNTRSGARLNATPVHYEPRNDVAVLRVSGLAARPLAFGAPKSGTKGAVLGFPHNGPYRVTPARLGETQTIITQDSYGRGPIRRRVATLRGRVVSGNSGGPMVDASGRVLTTIFASTSGARPGGFGVPDDVVQRALRSSSHEVSTGPCAP